MAKTQALQEQLEQIIQELGFALLACQKRKIKEGSLFVIAICHPEQHISQHDCETVHRRLIAELADDNCFFEVSSPGIGRTLKTDREYQLLAGKLVEVFWEEETLPDELLPQLQSWQSEQQQSNLSLPRNKKTAQATDILIAKLCQKTEKSLDVIPLGSTQTLSLPLAAVKKVALAMDNGIQHTIELDTEDL